MKKHMIFDFDGTMCLLFQHFDLDVTAKKMQEQMQKIGINISDLRDPFDIFAVVKAQTEEGTQLRRQALLLGDQLLTEAEVEAAKTGDPVYGVKEVFEELANADVVLGVSTNNSKESVLQFLKRMEMDEGIPIEGRVPGRPELMKPNVWSVAQMMKLQNGSIEDTVFVGDTKRDLDTAIALGCPFVGMVPTERKQRRLEAHMKNGIMVRDYYEFMRIMQP